MKRGRQTRVTVEQRQPVTWIIGGSYRKARDKAEQLGLDHRDRRVCRIYSIANVINGELRGLVLGKNDKIITVDLYLIPDVPQIVKLVEREIAILEAGIEIMNDI